MPIYYNGLKGLLETWFFIGVSLAAAYVVQSIRKGHRRHWFHFDGDLLSFGEKKLWAEWWVFSFGICFLLSFLMVGGDIIREMAWSLPESMAFVAGTFAVDRVAMIFEGEGPIGPRTGWKWPEFKWSPWPTWTPRPQRTPDDIGPARARRDFDNLTRGH